MKRARLRTKKASPFPTRSKQHGIDFENVKECGKELANAAAYLELHIEQGPVLLDLDLAARAPCSELSASSATRSPSTARPRIPAARR